MAEIVKKLTVRSVLGFLAAAGAAGATTTEIACAFSYPESYHQRSNRVSQIMRVLRPGGCAESLGTEPTTLYLGTPVHRWRITPAGIARYEHTRDSAKRRAVLDARRAGADASREQALAAARAELAGLITAGRTRYAFLDWRNAKIAELRTVPCTLAEIGELFGLTRERVRQIEMEMEEAGR